MAPPGNSSCTSSACGLDPISLVCARFEFQYVSDISDGNGSVIAQPDHLNFRCAPWIHYASSCATFAENFDWRQDLSIPCGTIRNAPTARKLRNRPGSRFFV